LLDGQPRAAVPTSFLLAPPFFLVLYQFEFSIMFGRLKK
jgi:hypothetical protein